MFDRIKRFFRSSIQWCKDNLKVVIAVVVTVLVVIAITACSTFGDVGEVQFGLKNDINKEVSS